jgi:hypothetical protein
MTWKQIAAGQPAPDFAALSVGDTLLIKGTTIDPDGTGINAIRLEAIPEPATCALLLGFGALGLVFWRRRQLDK